MLGAGREFALMRTASGKVRVKIFFLLVGQIFKPKYEFWMYGHVNRQSSLEVPSIYYFNVHIFHLEWFQ